MEKIFSSIAGLDVHQKQIVACILREPVRGKKVSKEIRNFDTTTPQLRQLNDWLIAEKIEAVVMESTGQYWRPVWNMLDGNFDKILAHPNEVKILK